VVNFALTLEINMILAQNLNSMIEIFLLMFAVAFMFDSSFK